MIFFAYIRKFGLFGALLFVSCGDLSLSDAALKRDLSGVDASTITLVAGVGNSTAFVGQSRADLENTLGDPFRVSEERTDYLSGRDTIQIWYRSAGGIETVGQANFISWRLRVLGPTGESVSSGANRDYIKAQFGEPSYESGPVLRYENLGVGFLLHFQEDYLIGAAVFNDGQTTNTSNVPVFDDFEVTNLVDADGDGYYSSYSIQYSVSTIDSIFFTARHYFRDYNSSDEWGLFETFNHTSSGFDLISDDMNNNFAQEYMDEVELRITIEYDGDIVVDQELGWVREESTFSDGL